MLRICTCLIVVWLWSAAYSSAEASPSPHNAAAAGGNAHEPAGQHNANAKPSSKLWVQFAWMAFAFLLVALKALFWPDKGDAKPMTPAEQKASQERLLDSYSTWKMWDAAARRDGTALTEEMKLVELRRLRRLNE